MTLKPPYETIPIEISEFNWIEEDKTYGEIQKYHIMFYPHEGKKRRSPQVYLIHNAITPIIDEMGIEKRDSHVLFIHKDVRLEQTIDKEDIKNILKLMNIFSYEIHEMVFDRRVETM